MIAASSVSPPTLSQYLHEVPSVNIAVMRAQKGRNCVHVDGALLREDLACALLLVVEGDVRAKRLDLLDLVVGTGGRDDLQAVRFCELHHGTVGRVRKLST